MLDKVEADYHVCGGCWKLVQLERQLPQEPYLPEKQQHILALVRAAPYMWHEYRSKWLRNFGCERMLHLGNLAAAQASSISLVDLDSLAQVRDR